METNDEEEFLILLQDKPIKEPRIHKVLKPTPTGIIYARYLPILLRKASIGGVQDLSKK